MTHQSSQFDVAIIGGGIVGVATAMALARTPGVSITVLEAEDRLATHQTGHNSGVIHSGLYYKPGSLKAQLCVAGREALFQFCAERGIPVDRCGKVVVATDESELPALAQLEERGRANGLSGVRRLDKRELRECEPHVWGTAGLLVPETGIVDFARVTECFADVAREAGHCVQTGTRVIDVRRTAHGLDLETTKGRIGCRFLVNCAGLQSDRVACMCGVDPRLRIIPFRGEYYELAAGRRHLVRNLIYPVPNAEYPFLGVHFTRTIDGRVEAGPNAVLAFKREGYGRWSLSARDALDIAGYAGFWRMVRRNWRMGLGEMYRSLSKQAFVRSLKKLVPELVADDLMRAGAGVRAQAIECDGSLVDDFRMIEAERMVHVVNAPSPAATASMSIGRLIAEHACRHFKLAR